MITLKGLKEKLTPSEPLQMTFGYLLIWIVMMAGIIYLIKTSETPQVNVEDYPKVIPLTTSVTASQKGLEGDPDVILTQTYKAVVNGKEVIVPVKDVPQGIAGSKQGVIKQEVDLTPVMKAIEKDAKEKYKINWEVGGGLGIHHRDVYIPLEIQRNFSKNHAVAIEAHIEPVIDPKEIQITGGEIKYKVLF